MYYILYYTLSATTQIFTSSDVEPSGSISLPHQLTSGVVGLYIATIQISGMVGLYIATVQISGVVAMGSVSLLYQYLVLWHENQ